MNLVINLCIFNFDPPVFTGEFVEAWNTWCHHHSAKETVKLLVKHEMWITIRGDNRANHENKSNLFDTVVGFAARHKSSK